MKKLNSDGMNKVLNDWLYENGFDCTVKLDTDFNYYYIDEVIGYAIISTRKRDDLFWCNAVANGLNTSVGVFEISFFHELGHHMTYDDLTDEEYRQSKWVKKYLGNTFEDYKIYYNLPEEKMATDWAIKYINSHMDEVRKLSEKFQEEMYKFLEENYVDLGNDFIRR